MWGVRLCFQNATHAPAAHWRWANRTETLTQFSALRKGMRSPNSVQCMLCLCFVMSTFCFCLFFAVVTFFDSSHYLPFCFLVVFRSCHFFGLNSFSFFVSCVMGGCVCWFAVSRSSLRSCLLSFFPASFFLACVIYFFLSAPPTPSINEKNVFNPRNSSRTEASSL